MGIDTIKRSKTKRNMEKVGKIFSYFKLVKIFNDFQFEQRRFVMRIIIICVR